MEEESEEQAPHIATLRLGPFDSHGTTRVRYFGRAIEVEHGIPGENVKAEIVGNKRPRGHIVSVLEPDPRRIEAPCPYFRDWACGGCQWQHISYNGQLQFKREDVDDAMHRAGLDCRITGVHTLKEPWRYRSSAGIALGKRAGFRRHGSLAIVPIRDCPISHPSIGRLMAVLNDHLEAGTLPDFHGRVRLDVRVAVTGEAERLQVLVRPDREKLPPEAEVATLVATLVNLDEVSGAALLKRDGSVQVHSGDLFAPVDVGGRPVFLTAGSFFQTNLSLLTRLIERLQKEAAPLQGKRVADVYGGVGVFGLFLAEGAAEVTVIESDTLAVQAGERTADAWELNNVRFLPGRAEESLERSEPYDVVILDPPRAGLGPTVVDVLIRQHPPLILYVSCLAESLARDLQSLTAAGYRVDALELYDFYPQTYHVELLCVLRREDAPGP